MQDDTGLDPKRVLRIFQKLKISSIEELHQALESGVVEQIFGSRMAQHVRQGLAQTGAMLLYHAHDLISSIETRFVSTTRGAPSTSNKAAR